MRLSMQLLWFVWLASTTALLCSATPLTVSWKSTDVESLTGTSINLPTFIEPAENNEDKQNEEDTEEGTAEDSEDGDEELEEEGVSTDEPPTDPFSDFDDLDALAKGILGSNANKDSIAPCFGTWWPSSGGYVYYYQDYGTGGGGAPPPSGGGGDAGDPGDGGGDYDDYGKRKRNRRMRRKRRMRRSRMKRAKRARTAKKKA